MTSGSRLDPWIDHYATRAAAMTASEIRALFAVASRPEVVSLAGGMPYIPALPLDAMADTAAAMIRDQGAVALQYGSGQGEVALREQICDVMSLGGISGHPDDVVVTAGSQMALDLMVRIFCDPGDVVLVESPSYVGALGVFRSYECTVVHVPMDAQGMSAAGLEEAITAAKARGQRIKLIYTIPSYHNPAGLTQPPQRRTEILQIAQKHGILLLEDDPYALLGFDGQVPRAIRAEDGDGVVYLGSFSKTIAAGLRVGWALAPHGVREKLVLAAESAILCPPNFTQYTVAEYLRTQPWFEQVKVYREIYRERRDALLDAMTQYLPAGTTWTVPEGGFYSWVTLPQGVDATAMLPRAVANLVAYVPGTGFYIDDQGRDSMRLSYCYPEPERITEGVRRLGAVIDAELDVMHTFGDTQMPRKPGPNSPAPDLV